MSKALNRTLVKSICPKRQPSVVPVRPGTSTYNINFAVKILVIQTGLNGPILASSDTTAMGRTRHVIIQCRGSTSRAPGRLANGKPSNCRSCIACCSQDEQIWKRKEADLINSKTMSLNDLIYTLTNHQTAGSWRATKHSRTIAGISWRVFKQARAFQCSCLLTINYQESRTSAQCNIEALQALFGTLPTT